MRLCALSPSPLLLTTGALQLDLPSPFYVHFIVHWCTTYCHYRYKSCPILPPLQRCTFKEPSYICCRQTTTTNTHHAYKLHHRTFSTIGCRVKKKKKIKDVHSAQHESIPDLLLYTLFLRNFLRIIWRVHFLEMIVFERVLLTSIQDITTNKKTLRQYSNRF